MIVWPRARRAIVPAARGEPGPVERLDFGARLRGERDMGSAPGLRARADPEERPAVFTEPGVGVGAGLLRSDFHDDVKAQRLQPAILILRLGWTCAAAS